MTSTNGARKFSTVLVPCTFDKGNRPIYVRPVADMTHRNKENAWPRIADELNRVLAESSGKALVHTVSYALTSYLRSRMERDRPVFSYRNSGGRARAIRDYVAAKDGAVLLAPSLDRGIDLPKDLCRVIVVCKVPYPSLGDKQVSARLYGTGATGRLWYQVETIRSLVQMTGRGMRSEDDYCESYILDSQFVTNVYRRNRALIPSWWREALIFERNK